MSQLPRFFLVGAEGFAAVGSNCEKELKNGFLLFDK